MTLAGLLTQGRLDRSAIRQSLISLVLIGWGSLAGQSADLGIFEGSADVGSVGFAGSVSYDSVARAYRVTGSGENMWFAEDGFHFVWKRVSGDVNLAARVVLSEDGGNAHRKACLMVRQSLEHDAAYADVALHADGLTSLQYREGKGAPTREIQSNRLRPAIVRLEKQGAYVSFSVAGEGESLTAAGGSFRLRLEDPFYVGLAVCAHDNRRKATAEFRDVTLVNEKFVLAPEPVLESTLEVVDIGSKDRRVIYHVRDHIEAPNWSLDGTFFVFNSRGRMYRLPQGGGKPVQIDTGFADRCNNDHGISPDGRQLAISHHAPPGGASLIYVVPMAGGMPRLITPRGPSYWHGWSPDGRTVAYCAERNKEYDVYTMSIEGGEEVRLTQAKGLDDGPEYSHDGKWIYFNSDRTGTMQIWRMAPDGSAQEQVTSDEYQNWFAHPSPDGKWLVFLSYEKEVQGHPANKDVQLRLMPVTGGQVQVLAKLFGGQGTINVPSWSPDSRRVAFVSYRLVNPER